MKKRLLFVFNPYSGKAQIKTQLFDIVDRMVKSDYEVTIYPTQASGDAIGKIAAEAGNYDLIVCSGGDGTLDEVVTGMMQRDVRVPLGYIPAGSTNDFASSLKIPKDMTAATEVAVTGRRFPCDIGSFHESVFVYVAAFGLFTDVSYTTSQEWKNLLGHAAYILKGVKSLHEIPSFHMEVHSNGEYFQDEFIYGMITNSTSVGGFKGMTGKDVLLDDGVFEVTLIKKPRNPIELNEIIAALINLVDDTNMIYSFKSNEIKITAKKPVSWTLDGEFGGEHADVVIKNICRAVEFIVPDADC